MKHSESSIQYQVCQYIRYQYRGTIFASDFGAGIKLNKFQAAMQKMNKSDKGYPDLFVAKPVGKWHGLFLELKRDGARVWLKDGLTLSTDKHVQEQAAVINKLLALDYYADFAVGFEGAKRIIDWYLNGAVGHPDKFVGATVKVPREAENDLPF